MPILNCLLHGPYTIVNSFSFNKEVQKQNPNLVMGSLGVDAVFTSIPLDETIDICLDQRFNGKQLISNLNKADIKLLLELAWCFLSPVGWSCYGLPPGPTFG